MPKQPRIHCSANEISCQETGQGTDDLVYIKDTRNRQNDVNPFPSFIYDAVHTRGHGTLVNSYGWKFKGPYGLEGNSIGH